MRIGCDIDGVLADWNTSFLRTLIRVSGKDATQPHPHFMPSTWWWPKELGFTEQDIQQALADAHASTQFWLSLTPYEHTREMLHKLHTLECEGHDIYFITSRSGNHAKRQTQDWLRHCGYHEHPTVLLSEDKASCARGLMLNLYLDDNIENVIAVGYQSATIQAFLLDRPWNQEVTDRSMLVFRDKTFHFFTRISDPSEMLVGARESMASVEAHSCRTSNAR